MASSLEVKPGGSVKCAPGDDYIVHLSQAALGESKKAGDSAIMYVKVGDQKLAIGTLSADNICFLDLPFSLDTMDLDSEEEEDEEEEGMRMEEMHIPKLKENGKAQGKEEQKGGKSGAAASKANAVVEKTKNTDDSDEDETDDSDEDGLSPDEEGDDDDSSDEDDSSEDDEESDEEETPKKSDTDKKRVAENALKTPASDKKAKVATPSGQKTGGKKNTHVATPHPAKQASKTPANNDKSKSPKSGGSISCNSCSKKFNSEMALQAHAKAKKH
ncbi:hypothetical protein PR202_ga06117 [Eleusine coracana subsp. coracana]|uniref:C2H2-type domain-containing protein n=1 Tax=Eleusine coracana subsp. coracana TaxID=191504 RepID=A0AAV5BWN5_ELECO|nr:hypothetical protein PR202_ga06117 [Eleusine coracana subsp. coracana]